MSSSRTKRRPMVETKAWVKIGRCVRLLSLVKFPSTKSVGVKWVICSLCLVATI